YPAPADTNGISRPLLALQADGRVDGDAVQPGEELCVTLEGAQGLVGAEKGVLHNVLSVFRVVHESQDRVVQPVLVATHKLAKGCRSPVQTVSDEPRIVGVHGSL